MRIRVFEEDVAGYSDECCRSFGGALSDNCERLSSGDISMTEEFFILLMLFVVCRTMEFTKSVTV